MTAIPRVLLFFIAMTLAGRSLAVSYYVSAAGNDSASGTSTSKPLKTIQKGLSKLASGDSLLLRRGDKWVVDGYELVVRTPNVSIGAYSGGNGNNRPVVDGRKANTGGWDGKLSVKANGVMVRDIEIRNSGGMGLRFLSVSDGTAENVKVDWTYRSGIQSHYSNNIKIRNSEVVHHNNGWKYYGEKDWGVGISIRGSSDVLVEKSTIREGFGEGINAFYGNKRIIIQDNLLYANRAVGIYIDASQDCLIQRNIILGTTNSLYFRSGSSVGHGIAINNETFEFQSGGGKLSNSDMLKNVRIYNNLVARSAAGIGIWGQYEGTNYSGVKIAHNILVDNDKQLVIYKDRFSAGGNVIANNIFLSISSNTTDYQIPVLSSGLKFIGNHWSVTPQKAILRHNGDVVGGAKLAKMSGWRNISSLTGVTSMDFVPAANSSTNGKAVTLTSIDVSSDFNRNPVPSNGANMGAFQGQSAAEKSPPFPPDLSVIQD